MKIRYTVLILSLVACTRVVADLHGRLPGIENLPFVFTFELENKTGMVVNGLKFDVSAGYYDGSNMIAHPSIFPNTDIISNGNNSIITWSGKEIDSRESVKVGGWNPGIPTDSSDCCSIDYRPNFQKIEWLVDGAQVNTNSEPNELNLIEPWFGRGLVEPKAVRVSYFDYAGDSENPELLGKAWYMGTGSFLFPFFNSTDKDIYFSYATANPDSLITDKILSDSLFDFSEESNIYVLDANSSDMRPLDDETPTPTVPIPPSLLLFGSGIIGLFGYQFRWKSTFLHYIV